MRVQLFGMPESQYRAIDPDDYGVHGTDFGEYHVDTRRDGLKLVDRTVERAAEFYGGTAFVLVHLVDEIGWIDDVPEFVEGYDPDRETFIVPCDYVGYWAGLPRG